MTAKAKPLSVSAFARLVGASHTAVQKAIESKRLEKSVRRDAGGRPKIVDLALAKKEWRENARKLPNSGGGVEKKVVPPAVPLPDVPQVGPAASAAPGDAPPASSSPSVDDLPPTSLAEAQLRYTIERTRGEEMKNAARSGELLEASAVHKRNFEIARQIRDGLMNIPDRVSAELAAEMDAARVHAKLSSEIRDVLEALADAIAAGEAAS